MPSSDSDNVVRAYVYVVAWSKHGPVKIGLTNAPIARLSQLQTGLPYRLRIYAAARLNQAEKAEKICHVAYAKAALIGEWFEITPAAAKKLLTTVATSLDPAFTWWKPKNLAAQLNSLPPPRPGTPDSPKPKGCRQLAVSELQWQRKQGWR